MARPLLSGTRSSSSPLRYPLPVRQSSELAIVEDRNYSDEMEYVISRCTSPTPYSLPPAKTSDLSFLRVTHAVSGHLRLQSNSSTTLSTLSYGKQLPPSKGRKSFMRVLQWLVPCISGSHHGYADDASEKRYGKPLRDSPCSEATRAEKMSARPGVIRKDAHKEQSPPLSLARLETIEEREEEYI